ncbi:MAG TPA: HAD family hydrolase [Planctomycetes bacterium]|nr:HAD family hydrolase [Planctomycetota bacterium]
MPSPLLFDAVLFDLDGTLVATDRFWIQAAKAGARRAFEELGVERSLPTGEEWMSLVGLPLAEGFARLFGDLSDAERALLLERCEEEEGRLIAAGGAAWMPGAREVMARLREAGVRLAIASNCSEGYLTQMRGELGLDEFVEEAWCLDSPGISNKADMIERILERLGTRSAIFVGDRAGDRDSAWANGIPHVHCSFGFAGRGEEVEAEATIGDMGELLGVLGRRTRWIRSILEGIGVALGPRGPFVLGVTGDFASGKTLFARDAARLLRAHGQDAVAVSIGGAWGRGTAQGSSGPGLDLDRLELELFEPHARGEAVELPDAAIADPAGPRVLAGDAVLLAEGSFLLDPRLLARLDRALYLGVSEEVMWRRAMGREGRVEGVSALERIRGELLPALRDHRGHYRPDRLADRVLDGSNPLGPSPRSA